MKFFVIVFVAVCADGKQAVNVAFSEAETIAIAREHALADAEYMRKKSGYESVAVHTFPFQRQRLRDLLDGKAPKTSLEEHDQPISVDQWRKNKGI